MVAGWVRFGARRLGHAAVLMYAGAVLARHLERILDDLDRELRLRADLRAWAEGTRNLLG